MNITDPVTDSEEHIHTNTEFAELLNLLLPGFSSTYAVDSVTRELIIDPISVLDFYLIAEE